MKKVTLSTITPLNVTSLQTLHSKILAFTGKPEEWALENERARERAFATRSNARLFKYWYLRSQVLKGFQGKVKGITPKTRVQAALKGFRDAESSVSSVNDRLFDGWNKPLPPAIRSKLVKARRVIAETLGHTFPIEALPEACDFSSGATTELTRPESDRQKKWLTATDVTKKALPYVLAFRKWARLDEPMFHPEAPADTPRGGNARLRVVSGNKVFTVPKRFDKDRTCAKEPGWMMFFQKGVGTLIRSALNQVGLLHPDAQEQHARMAQDASKTGKAATLDLKAASDSISLALVMLLLPESWVRVLLDLRSEEGLLPDGTKVLYEKISSMGNGYTFELETLLFWALARACCSEDEEVSVYGDDVICPTHRAQDIAELYKFCGFELNQEKSFSSGPFRESCGGHFWNGVNVKPFYIDVLPTKLYEVINLHNDLVTWMSDGLILHRLVEIARACRALVPKKYWGPMGTAGCLWSDWDEARPTFQKPPSRRNQPYYGHWRVRVVRREVVNKQHDYYLGSLLDTYWRQRRVYTNRDRSSAFRRTSLRQAALAHRQREQRAVSSADFAYALTRECEGWVAVGVGLGWPRLPVRIALP